jgi:hypothetical protein
MPRDFAKQAPGKMPSPSKFPVFESSGFRFQFPGFEQLFDQAQKVGSFFANSFSFYTSL